MPAEKNQNTAATESATNENPKAAANPVEETPLEGFASICSVLVLALFILTFLAQNFEIPSGSMLNTLLVGDHVIVDRITLAPACRWMPLVHYRPVEHGDIVVFLKPGEPDMFLVKRVIGVPGDRLHLVDGVLYRNGVAVSEPHALREDPSPNSGSSPVGQDQYRDNFPRVRPEFSGNVTETWLVDMPNHVVDGDLVVPPDSYFMMGDNRSASLDSRYWGFVPKENVVGRPLLVYWSFVTSEDQQYKTTAGERIGYLGHILLHFFGDTRWSRTLHLVR
jgi:signal peptidase I